MIKYISAVVFIVSAVVYSIPAKENAPAMPEELRTAVPPITYIENSYDEVLFTDGDGNLYSYNKHFLIYHVMIQNPNYFPVGTVLIKKGDM